MMKLIFTTFFLIIYSASVSAAPQISNVQGNVSNSNSITINGTGFGPNGPQVVIFDDFESGTPGTDIQMGQNSATVGGWNKMVGNIGPKYSDGSEDVRNPGCVSGNRCFRADHSQSWIERIEAHIPNGGSKDVFASVWMKIPTQDNWPGEGNPAGINWKTIWLHAPKNSIYPAPYDVLGNGGSSAIIAANGLSDSNDPIKFNAIYFNMNFQKGSWMRISEWIHGANDLTGHIDLWELTNNGMIHKVNKDTITLDGPNDKFTRMDLNGYGRTTANSHPMFDDFYMAVGPNARARIEIGDQPTYTACTKMTILTPTSWSDNQIVADVREGPFSNGEQAYVFVVDSNGDVSSQGFPITFGSSGQNQNLLLFDPFEGPSSNEMISFDEADCPNPSFVGSVSNAIKSDGWNSSWSPLPSWNAGTSDSGLQTLPVSPSAPNGGQYALLQHWDTNLCSNGPNWMRYNFPSPLTHGDTLDVEFYLKYDANFLLTSPPTIKMLGFKFNTGDYIYWNSHWGGPMKINQGLNVSGWQIYDARANGGAYSLPLGEWVHLRLQMKLAEEGKSEDGTMYIWVNDVLRWDYDGIYTHESGAAMTFLEIQTTYNNGINGPNQKRFFDNFKINVLRAGSTPPPGPGPGPNPEPEPEPNPISDSESGNGQFVNILNSENGFKTIIPCDSTINIYSQLGELIESLTCSGNQTILDASQYPSGIYIIHREGQDPKKVVVVK